MQSLQRRNAYHREANHGRENHGTDQETYNGLRSDIEQIKNQLRDMKQMMRISFDLQMDIQRAIRQEVAAAMVAACNMQTAHIQTGSFTAPPPPTINGKLIVKNLEFLTSITCPCSWCNCQSAHPSNSIGPMHYLFTASN